MKFLLSESFVFIPENSKYFSSLYGYNVALVSRYHCKSQNSNSKGTFGRTDQEFQTYSMRDEVCQIKHKEA